MAVHYPEFMKTASQDLNCQVASIDLGGALTYQGPVTPEQQADIVAVFTKVSKENAELLKQCREKMKAKAAESEASKTAKKTEPNKPSQKK